jgi:general secretion pathway protein I
VLADVVADNVAVDAVLADIAHLDDDAAGRESLGGHDWRWTRRVSATDEPDMLRIDVAVHPAGDERVAAELSLFRDGGR